MPERTPVYFYTLTIDGFGSDLGVQIGESFVLPLGYAIKNGLEGAMIGLVGVKSVKCPTSGIEFFRENYYRDTPDPELSFCPTAEGLSFFRITARPGYKLVNRAVNLKKIPIEGEKFELLDYLSKEAELAWIDLGVTHVSQRLAVVHIQGVNGNDHIIRFCPPPPVAYRAPEGLRLLEPN